MAGTTLPLWCNGHAGTVRRIEKGIVVAVLDKIATRTGQPEFRFRPDELKPEDSHEQVEKESAFAGADGEIQASQA